MLRLPLKIGGRPRAGDRSAMSARTSGRLHRPVNYNEKGGGGGSAPAWTLQLGGGDAALDKENTSSGAAAPAARKSGAGRQQKAPAVPQKGRNAGLERLPIGERQRGERGLRWVATAVACRCLSCAHGGDTQQLGVQSCQFLLLTLFSCREEDTKAGKASGSGKHRSNGAAAAPPAAAGKEVLPGVYVKGANLPAPAAKLGSGGKSRDAAAAGAGGGGKNAAAQQAGQPVNAEAPGPAAKSGSGGKRKAASSAAANEAGPSGSGQVAQAAPSAAGRPDPKRQKPGVAWSRLAEQERRGAAPAAAATAPPAPPPAADQGDMPAALVMPGSDAEALLEQYSANFRALQV